MIQSFNCKISLINSCLIVLICLIIYKIKTLIDGRINIISHSLICRIYKISIIRLILRINNRRIYLICNITESSIFWKIVQIDNCLISFIFEQTIWIVILKVDRINYCRISLIRIVTLYIIYIKNSWQDCLWALNIRIIWVNWFYLNL